MITTVLKGANLEGANLRGINLGYANLEGANLIRANLRRAHLARAHINGADLSLRSAVLIETNLTDANLTGCRVHGISAWSLKLDGTKQRDLVITRPSEPEITVDSLEVAQFIYLLLHNDKIRDVIDTIGKKGVLLLGRFTEGRLAVLERLREELRNRDFVPMVFNFDSRRPRTSPRRYGCSPASPVS